MAIDGYNIRAKAACKEQLSMYLYGYKNIAELNKFNRLTLLWEELLINSRTAARKHRGLGHGIPGQMPSC
jgi:hypothetical protein